MTLETLFSKLVPHPAQTGDARRKKHGSGAAATPRDATARTGVGTLVVDIVGADDLPSADVNGKSDPFVVLDLDGQTFRSTARPRTLAPRWTDQRTEFVLDDLSAVLVASVFDEDRFGKDELLGRVALPAVTLDWNAPALRVLPLRSKSLARRTRGTLTLRLTARWDVCRAALAALAPRAGGGDDGDPAFKAALFLRNVQRVRDLLAGGTAASRWLQECLAWTRPGRSAAALAAFSVATYFFEPYMAPLFGAACLLAGPAFGEAAGRTTRVDADAATPSDDGTDAGRPLFSLSSEEREARPQEGDPETSLLHKLRHGSAFLQNGLGRLASFVERVGALAAFRVPCLSWLVLGFLLACALLLYLVPLRWIVLGWGIHLFTKKLRRPRRPPTSEVLNFLDRVPDRPTLEKYFDPLDAVALGASPSPSPDPRDRTRKKRSFFNAGPFSKKAEPTRPRASSSVEL